MALHLVYEKTAETDLDVTYEYGQVWDERDRRLVIDKADPDGPPKEGRNDRLDDKVIAAILSELSGDVWPEGGAIVS